MTSSRSRKPGLKRTLRLSIKRKGLLLWSGSRRRLKKKRQRSTYASSRIWFDILCVSTILYLMCSPESCCLLDFCFPQKLLKTEHSLWQLYTIEKDTEKMEAELAEDRESLQQVQEENQSADSELTAKKKEQSAFLKKMTLCEKSIAKKRLELDKKVNAFLSILVITLYAAI